MEIMTKKTLINISLVFYFFFLGGSSWASDGGWVRPMLTKVSSTYNVSENGYSISVNYSCDYKVNGYVQSLTIFINESFLGGYTFDLDSELDIELMRDNNKLLFHRLTEEELLNVLAGRKANIKLDSSLFKDLISLEQLRQTMLDNKKINGVPISNLVETGKEFGLKVLLDGIEIKRVPVNIGFVVDNKFKGIVRSCESDEQLKAQMEDGKRQLMKDEKSRDLMGVVKLLSWIALLGLLAFVLNKYIRKKSSKNSSQ
jgi:hypothetical protein